MSSITNSSSITSLTNYTLTLIAHTISILLWRGNLQSDNNDNDSNVDDVNILSNDSTVVISNLSNTYTREGGRSSISSQNTSNTNTNVINDLSRFEDEAEKKTVIDYDGKTT